MQYFEMRLSIGNECGGTWPRNGSCANDNSSKEQDIFDHIVSRELVDDRD